VHGGYVFEHWRWLTNITPIYAPDFGEGMDTGATEEISALLTGPSFGALYRVAPELSLEATAYRRMRIPSWQQLMRPIQNGDVLTVAADRINAETITGGQIGPAFGNGTLEARAVAYWNDVASPITAVTLSNTVRQTTNLGHARETGVEAAASWRMAKPWLAGVSYTYANARVTEAADAQLVGKQLAQTPRHRATALVAFDQPKLVTLTTAVRYVAGRYEDALNTIAVKPFTVVDAMATRKLVRGLAGFVAVENLFDRRYVANLAGVDTIGAPRLVQVGVRLDSARW
jgi:outer membrane receptor protein involved in Fe transport